jgi:hypothetical protein
MSFINTIVVDEFGINIASRFMTNRPAPYNNIKGRGIEPSWGLSYGQWRALRAALVAGAKPNKACAEFMRKAGLDPATERQVFYNGFQVTFPGETVTTMRATNKQLKLRGIRL